MKKEAKKNANSAIIHDINNLLTTSSLSVEILLQELQGGLNPTQKKHLKIILSEGKKMKSLIKKIN